MDASSVVLVPGAVVGGYTIVRCLGTGGMGTVYLVKHPRLPKHDALKVLAPGLGSDPSFRARFEREAHLAAQLDHPNVVSVHDCGNTDGVMWLAMQFVDGIDVATLLRRSPSGLDPAHAVDILTQAARGLDAAHQHGILHRDIKPANLMVTPGWDGSPDSERVLVSDFGIARTLDNTSALTLTGDFLGTLAYAAPELIEGRQVDHRADIYSLGCTLHALLTGSVVFPRANLMAVMQAHLAAAPPRPSETHPQLPPAIDAVIATAMAKDPMDRYPTCRALADAAASALTGSRAPATIHFATPTPQPATVVAKRPPKSAGRVRHRRALGAAALVLAALVAAAVLIFLRSNDTGNSAHPAASMPPAAAAPVTSSESNSRPATTTFTPPSTLSGRWSGPVSGDQTGFDVVADISDGPPMTAKVSYPQLDCRGTWADNGTSRPTVRHLTETIDQGNCVRSAITLVPKDDGTLDFSSTYYSASQRRDLTVHAILRR